ncbi:MAG: hypothetical protein B6D76_03530 [gamma proteobacterium symbiont of Stewartia floridana]|nr:MAG: hypothetical protein B6D76_03530 [gamma proteobacterium symbiont of Stewartia floridana]RLW59000.1 MAG: hypothetical protein B6D75_12030 [gamma proteobacterium symbiont of Stewartia floridana]
MGNIQEKFALLREDISLQSDYIFELLFELGQASPGKARMLAGILKEARAELAELFRKETSMLRLQETNNV